MHNHIRKTSIIITLIAVIMIGCRFYFSTTKDQYSAQLSHPSVQRGENLVYTICAGCHFDHQTGKFIGKHLNDLPRIAGRLYSSNITHGNGAGRPDQYSDAEFFYLFKTGIAKSGKFMPYMMKPMMADADIDDMIAFLRSNDKALAADESSVGMTKINFAGRTGIRFLMGPQPYNKGVERPNENDAVVYGRYLVAVIGCYHCHSRKTTGLDFFNAEKTKGYLQGGIKLKDKNDKRIYATNLTPDKETGIGYFTKEEFRDAIRKGISPSGYELSTPMDRFDRLTDQQVDAIYTYLQSLPAVRHKIVRRQ